MFRIKLFQTRWSVITYFSHSNPITLGQFSEIIEIIVHFTCHQETQQSIVNVNVEGSRAESLTTHAVLYGEEEEEGGL